MKAIILNAGKSEKLAGYSMNKPKCLLEIENNSILEIQLNALYNCGISDVSVVRGYCKEEINIPGIKYYDNKYYDDTNVLYSLFCAEDELNNDLIIIYGDILFTDNTIKRIIESKQDIAIGVMTNTEKYLKKSSVDFYEKEMLIFDAENNVQQIGKGLLEVNHANSGLFTGIIKCTKKGAQILKNNYNRIDSIKEKSKYLNAEKLKNAWITDLLNELCEMGVVLKCVMIEKDWFEIDTNEDYINVKNNSEFISKIIKIKTDWEDRSNTYDSINWVNRNETLDQIVSFCEDVNTKKVLDIGTGTGKVLKSLKAKYPEGIYYGVDLSKSMMDKIDKNLGFNLLQSKIEDLSMFEDDFFDVVTARMVMHHSEDLNKAFSEVNRILKPNGKFIICEGTPPDRYSVEFYEDMFKYKEDRHTFLLDDLTNLYINNNFKDILSKTIVLNNMSLNNWLNNAGVPVRNIDIIRKMHFEADRLVKKAYDMNIVEDDIIMNWKFAVICGRK